MTSNSNHNISEDFEWTADYDPLLEQIASTDIVDSEWGILRDMIKYKINKNVDDFLNDKIPPPSHDQPTTVPVPSQSPQDSPNHGLVLPPFPPRPPGKELVNKTLPDKMTQEETETLKDEIFALLDDFERKPPFTIQRICELSLKPSEHYKSVGKYLRAIERTVLVTSTWDMFPPVPLTATDSTSAAFSSLTSSASNPASRPPSTPLFSPIPFLHEDARSRSPSPGPSPLALGSRALSPGASDVPAAPLGPSGLSPTVRAIGLVDELDDPNPEHLSDKPTPLSATTDVRVSASKSLAERFTKPLDKVPAAAAPEPVAETAEETPRSSDDMEVEDMVLDKQPEEEDTSNKIKDDS